MADTNKPNTNKWGKPATFYISNEQRRKLAYAAQQREEKIGAPVSFSRMVAFLLDGLPEPPKDWKAPAKRK